MTWHQISVRAPAATMIIQAKTKYFFFFLKISLINILRLRQNAHHFPDDIFKWIFFFFFQINNIPALVQIMAYRQSGDKLLSELMMLNRHQTILHNFFNFSSIERYHACHIFCKQISNEQKSQICEKCVIWKQIHEKWESVITESWPTFSNGRVRYWAGPSYQPPPATEWPHYIMTNWPQVVPQKAHRCENKQTFFDLPLLLGKASV